MHETVENFLNQYKDIKINAPKVPENLGHPHAVFNWIIKDSMIPYLELLGVETPYSEMLAEAKGLRELFVPHRSQGESHRGWSSLTIHGISSQHTNTPNMYGLKREDVTYNWTEIQDRCPVTVNYFKNVFPYKQYDRVRFMLLEPNGYIMPHSDSSNYFLAGAINMSLNNPENCYLTTNHGSVPFRNTGSTFLFANHYHHVAANYSNEERFHIIVHGTWKDSYVDLVNQSYYNIM